MQGTVFNIERSSLYDGPGVRTVVFCKGCPLRCAWCHNPEGIMYAPQIMYNADRCIGCGGCAEICEHGAHALKGSFDRSLCMACGACVAGCFSGALSMAGESLTVEQIMQTLRLDAGMFAATGGGLTISGGEPLAQADFTIALAIAAKAEGFHVCVETSGYGNADKLAALASVTDLFLYDCKLINPDDFSYWCGGNVQIVFDNLALLERLRAQVILRCPIIPGVNDNDAHIYAVATLANAHNCIREIQFQPYHRLGLSKSAQLGIFPAMQAKPLEKNELVALADRLQTLCDKSVAIN